MPEPLSPLFAELYLQEGLDQSMDQLFASFGIPFVIEDFMERPMFLTVNGYAYCRADYRMSWRLLWVMPKLLYWAVTSWRKMLRTVIPSWRDEGLPAYLQTVEEWRHFPP